MSFDIAARLFSLLLHLVLFGFFGGLGGRFLGGGGEGAGCFAVAGCSLLGARVLLRYIVPKMNPEQALLFGIVTPFSIPEEW